MNRPPKYTLLLKGPFSVVGFFDALWTEEQIACSVTTTKPHMDEMKCGKHSYSGLLRFFDFSPDKVVAKVNTSTGHF